MLLSELPRSFSEHKTFVFLGAGSGICERFPPSLRLPLGLDIMNALLAAKFPRVPAEDRIKNFQKLTDGTAPTPDSVWNSLVQENDAIREYYTSLVELFGDEKPVPPAYYKFARWFLTAAHVAGAATTNFDEKIDAALRSIASDASKQAGRDYYLASLPEDFSYHFEARTDFKQLVQKIHGTLSRPWSIVAGFKCIAASRAKTGSAAKGQITSYDLLADALRLASNWVFVGYSFADPYLRDFLSKNAPSDHKRIYVIAPDASRNEQISRFKQELETKKRGKSPSHVEFELIDETAENFFDYILPGHAEDDVAIVSLPSVEKNILQKGPSHLGDECKGRFASRGYIPGVPYRFPDPIYGDLVFSAEMAPGLLQFIDTGEIQRLRYIKQLSFVHLKYPAALHDRFSHTIGVTYLADRCMQEMPLAAAEQALGRGLDSTTKLAFCVACVMHDSGHGPLGHTLDSVKTCLGLNRPHERDSIKLYQVADEKSVFADLDKAHEATGVRKEEVLQILEGSHPLSPLLSNKGLDLDRLDFVLRDAFHASLALPELADPNTTSSKIAALAGKLPEIVKALRLVRLVEPHVTSSGVVCPTVLVVQREASSAVKAVAELYASLYDQVYYCWQNACAQTMIGIAIEEVLRSHKYSVADVLRLTDMELFTALEEFENPRVKELAYLVKYRRLHDSVGEIRFTERVTEEMAREIVHALEVCVYGTATIKETHRSVDGPFDVMFAVRPAKVFEVAFLDVLNFEEPVRSDDIKKESLASTEGRVLVFRWPGSTRKIDLSRLAQVLRDHPDIDLKSARVCGST